MKELQTDGFSLVPAVFASDAIATFRQVITDTIDRVARVMLTPFETSLPSAPFDERLERVARLDLAYASALLQVVMADAQRDPRLRALAGHRRLTGVVADALAPQVMTGHVVRTRAAIPSFMTRLSPWHQDVPRPESGRGCATVRVACWIPLSDVDEHSGALEVLPGAWDEPLSHELGPGGQFSIPDAALSSREPRVVSMRAGDVLLLDRYIPHRSRPATGLRGRWSVVMWVKAGHRPS
jgi:ectoine hydroxylase-related dioxygenase (phytanoyl-CoA dioxygenase family)